MSTLGTREIAPEPQWRIPLAAPDGCGVVVPACDVRAPLLIVTRRVGEGLRIGGEAALCFDCGPEGGVYHPADASMAEIVTVAERLPSAPGYGGADDLTADERAAYDRAVRARLDAMG